MGFFSSLKSPNPAFFTSSELSLIRNSFNCLIKKYDDYEFLNEWKTEHPKINRSIDIPNRERETFDYTIKVNNNKYCFHFNKGGFFVDKYKPSWKGADIKTEIEEFLDGEEINAREIIAWLRINASVNKDGIYYPFKGFAKRIILRYEEPEQNLHLNQNSKDKFKDLEKHYLEKIK